VEAEGVGELETKYDNSKKTLGLFQFLPSMLFLAAPLAIYNFAVLTLEGCI
jgi:hypothetical protein